jgi:hypothetical protein
MARPVAKPTGFMDHSLVLRGRVYRTPGLMFRFPLNSVVFQARVSGRGHGHYRNRRIFGPPINVPKISYSR